MNLIKYAIGIVLAYFLLFRLVLPYLFSQPSWLALACGVVIVCLTVYYGMYLAKGETKNVEE